MHCNLHFVPFNSWDYRNTTEKRLYVIEGILQNKHPVALKRRKKSVTYKQRRNIPRPGNYVYLNRRPNRIPAL